MLVSSKTDILPHWSRYVEKNIKKVALTFFSLILKKKAQNS